MRLGWPGLMWSPSSQDLPLECVIELMEHYHDQAMEFADATLLAVAGGRTRSCPPDLLMSEAR